MPIDLSHPRLVRYCCPSLTSLNGLLTSFVFGCLMLNKIYGCCCRWNKVEPLLKSYLGNSLHLLGTPICQQSLGLLLLLRRNAGVRKTCTT